MPDSEQICDMCGGALRVARERVLRSADAYYGHRSTIEHFGTPDSRHPVNNVACIRLGHCAMKDEYDAALGQYEALARAVGVLHDGGCCPAVDSCFDDVGVCHVHAYRDEAERLAREVLDA